MTFFSDLRLAVRSLRQTPGLVAVAGFSLAIGIATNVTMFAALDPLVFHPFDLPDGDRLVHVVSYIPKHVGNSGSTSLPDLRDWQREARTVELAPFEYATFNWSNGEPPEHLAGARAGGGLFELSGISPILGRSIRREDETSGRPVALLTEALWRNRFGADHNVLGRPMVLDGIVHTIVGVLPRRHRFPFVDADVWTAIVDTGATDRAIRSVSVVGRLRPGATVAGAQAELHTIVARLGESFPATNRDFDVLVATFEHDLVPGGSRQAAVILFAAVGFVLLIACANVANLLLTRGAGRARELAVRAALGASRGRITRHLLAESLVLAAIGGALGLVISIGGVAWIRDLLSMPGFARAGIEAVRLSGRAFGFGLTVTVLAAVIFGLFPAFRAAAPDLNRSLRDGDRGATGGAGRSRLRSGLVIGEVALALALLVSASLLIQTSLRFQKMDLGFEPADAVSFQTVLTDRSFRDSTRRAAFADDVVERLRGVPGVTAAGAGSSLPLYGQYDGSLLIVGEPESKPGAAWRLIFRVSPGYVQATGMRLLRGRGIEPTDRMGSPRVALINETLARGHWGGASPLGRRLHHGNHDYEIVGVVRDVAVGGELEQPPLETAYFAISQSPPNYFSFVVRSPASAEALAPQLRAAVEAVAPGQPIYDLAPLDRIAQIAWRDYQIMTQLLTVLGAAALALAVIGVYGAMSHAVAQRSTEIGIRRALGAETRDVLRLLGKHGALMVGIGSAVGIPVAFGMARLIASILTGVRPFDPIAFIGTPVALALTAAIATLLPAWRAVRVDALVALRNQ